jgi:hypothetical protein
MVVVRSSLAARVRELLSAISAQTIAIRRTSIAVPLTVAHQWAKTSHTMRQTTKAPSELAMTLEFASSKLLSSKPKSMDTSALDLGHFSMLP